MNVGESLLVNHYMTHARVGNIINRAAGSVYGG